MREENYVFSSVCPGLEGLEGGKGPPGPTSKAVPVVIPGLNSPDRAMREFATLTGEGEFRKG